jgi:hypothetical protein
LLIAIDWNCYWIISLKALTLLFIEYKITLILVGIGISNLGREILT